eukprot:TRINITY_DN34236_c0_g1_i1.p1 TRINITY_DN34236_c0_g1~~TRINITY_DN34236_c0_g1_i1.p1  ORF type:complete len:482 (-),score=48.14 TRINITY_DN34236_c0_g1_i1:76-1521(-)
MPRALEGAVCLAALVSRSNYCCVQAQIYTLVKTPVPRSMDPEILQIFYVWSGKDAPRGRKPPSLQFSNLILESKQADIDPSNYTGIQLFFVPFDVSWKLFGTCSDSTDVDYGFADYEGQVLIRRDINPEFNDRNIYQHTVMAAGSKENDSSQHFIPQTEEYLLVLSNCGGSDAFTVSGTVTVTNSHGYLPANRYYGMSSNICTFGVYMTLGVIWINRIWLCWYDAVCIHWCIAAVIGLGAAESLVWYVTLRDWNHRGYRSHALFGFAICTSVMKTSFSFALAIATSLGWGVTKPFLEIVNLRLLQALTFGYIVFDFATAYMAEFGENIRDQARRTLLPSAVAGCIHAVAFIWLLTALADTLKMLKERRQTELLLVFNRFFYILVFAFFSGFLKGLSGVFTFMKPEYLRYEWIFHDAWSQIMFLSVVSAVMYLWAPGRNGNRFSRHSGRRSDLESTSSLPLTSMSGQERELSSGVDGAGIYP